MSLDNYGRDYADDLHRLADSTARIAEALEALTGLFASAPYEEDQPLHRLAEAAETLVESSWVVRNGVRGNRHVNRLDPAHVDV